MRRSLIAVLLLAVACGPQAQPASGTVAQVSPTPAARVSPTPVSQASPTPVSQTSPNAEGSPQPVPPSSSPANSGPCAPVCVSRTLLFAALESSSGTGPLDTVVIDGLYGGIRASATFKPMPIPYVGCEAAVLPASAQVAGGKVYFADGNGSIGSLGADGQVTQITKFPLGPSQQMLSFAVSPDGRNLLAAIFTLPPKPASASPCNGTAPFAPGAFTLDVYSAQAGGASNLLYHQVLSTSTTAPYPDVMAFAGWNRVGPFGTYPTVWATQGGGPAHYYGVPVRIDASTGKVLGQVSDPQSCQVWDIADSGDYVCAPSSFSFSVRHPDGSEIWGWQSPTGSQSWVYDLLSPQEGRVVSSGVGSEVFCWGVCDVKLPSNFSYMGWLDDTTLIGTLHNSPAVEGDVGFDSITVPAGPVDLGFKGTFVGTLQT